MTNEKCIHCGSVEGGELKCEHCATYMDNPMTNESKAERLGVVKIGSKEYDLSSDFDLQCLYDRIEMNTYPMCRMSKELASHISRMSKQNTRPNASEGGDVADLEFYLMGKLCITQGTANDVIKHILSKTQPDPRIKEAVEMLDKVDNMVCKLPIRTVEYEKILTELTKIKTTLEK